MKAACEPSEIDFSIDPLWFFSPEKKNMQGVTESKLNLLSGIVDTPV